MTATAEAQVAGARPKQRRMSPVQRKADIVARAATFFAEHGFERSTRDLAAWLGVTQPLLYRYFPSKDDLVGEVYAHVYLQRWNPQWDDVLGDRSRPLRWRLEQFLRRLHADDLHARLDPHLSLRRPEGHRPEPTLHRSHRGSTARADRLGGAPRGGAAAAEPRPAEIELAWLLHGGIFYHGVRRHVFGAPVLEDRTAMIRNALDLFLAGAREVLE